MKQRAGLKHQHDLRGSFLDQTIINRERRVKGARRKIGNPSYKYDKKNRIHYYKLTYRWETVRQFVEEFRAAVPARQAKKEVTHG